MAALLDLSTALVLAQNNVPGPEPVPWFLNGPWIPFLLIGVMFYFLLIRPERRKRAEMAGMRSNLKKNDHVITIGGIHGVVVNAPQDSADITIRVDEGNNTRLRLRRAAIDQVIIDREDDETES